MPDSIVPAPAVAPAEPPKSGFKTTEAWLTMIGLGLLAAGAQQLVALLPTLATNPALPPWAAMAVPLAVAGLGWTAKRLIVEYTKARVALKLPVADVTAAVAAGAAAANDTNDRVLAMLNK